VSFALKNYAQEKIVSLIEVTLVHCKGPCRCTDQTGRDRHRHRGLDRAQEYSDVLERAGDAETRTSRLEHDQLNRPCGQPAARHRQQPECDHHRRRRAVRARRSADHPAGRRAVRRARVKPETSLVCVRGKRRRSSCRPMTTRFNGDTQGTVKLISADTFQGRNGPARRMHPHY